MGLSSKSIKSSNTNLYLLIHKISVLIIEKLNHSAKQLVDLYMWCVARFGIICTILKMWKTPMEECYF